MFAAHAATVLGILIAKNIYSKMKTTGGLQGETGPKDQEATQVKQVLS